MKRRIAVPLISAVFTAAVTTILIGKDRTDVAEAAAQCMEETRDLRHCSRPEGDLWVFVAAFALAGTIVGAAGYSVGNNDTRGGNSGA
jgi:hypothetical protein